jgi:DNA-binding response OmpR family regulator
MNQVLQGRRILVVEDEYLVATDVADTLRESGAEVVGPFARVQPALDAIESEDISGAVLDVRLDGETIEKVAALLAARGVPVLLTTGYEGEQLPPELRHLPRLRKPFVGGDLLRKLARAYQEAGQ